MASGVQASSECIEAFSDLKLSHKYKYIVYSLGEGNKEIVISHKEAQSAGKTNKEYFDDLVSKFPADDCRYSVFDFEYEKTDGSGKRNKLCFIIWSPDSATIKKKMVYSSSKEALRKSLLGIQVDVQATDFDEINYDAVFDKCDKLR